MKTYMTSSMRRLVIDRLLSEKQYVSFEQLEEVLKASSPTIKRDLRYMREELGAPIRYSKSKGGYYYAKSAQQMLDEKKKARAEARQTRGVPFDPFRKPAVEKSPRLRSREWYTSEELLVLTSAYDLLGELENDPLSALAQELAPLRARVMSLFSLGGTTPRELMRHVKVIDHRIMFHEPAAFELTGCALCLKQKLKISYHSTRTNATTERVISPQRLVHYRNRWYVDAYCYETNALKTFQIENITHADLLTEPGEQIPAEQIEAELDAGYGLFRGKSISMAKLHFQESAGRYVLREAWHPKQSVEQLRDGSMILSVPYADPTEIVGEILRWGSQVEVTEPAELREAVRAAAAGIAALYAPEEPGKSAAELKEDTEPSLWPASDPA